MCANAASCQVKTTKPRVGKIQVSGISCVISGLTLAGLLHMLGEELVVYRASKVVLTSYR